MKRSINILTITVLICGASLFYFLARPLPTESAGIVAYPGFPLNQPRSVSFDLNETALDGKTRREKLDQMRDWLLYAVLSESGRSPKEMGQMLFDLPAARRDYLHGVGDYDYSVARSRRVGDGEVVALLPEGDPQDRIDQLAHIADEQGKNAGEVPKSILVFEYKLNIADGTQNPSGEITRRDTIDGKELFTSKYGYYESNIRNLNDLTQFLKQVDDVVFAQPEGDSLRLGGRKITGHAYRSIGAEDVAAIWQSEAARKQKGLSSGSGFSLDPSYDMEKLKEFFDAHFASALDLDQLGMPPDFSLPNFGLGSPFQPQAVVPKKSGPTAAAVSSALGRDEIDPFFDWLAELDRKDHVLADLLQSYVHDKFVFQQARYDGELKGTQVGMILFYTDLIAKLWDQGFHGSGPKGVEDFRSQPALWTTGLSPVHCQQAEENPFSRLWFGPNDQQYQPTTANQGLLFARNATRLFAKSSDSLSQRKEVEAHSGTATFINWWDAHFEEVARYEPRYEQLNQIMKWSLLITWLNHTNKGQTLGFLKDVNVNHSYWFPDWARQQSDLRFHEWQNVKFFPAGYKKTSNEALPLLQSDLFRACGTQHWIIGGVSLSSEEAFAGRALVSTETRVANLARRAGVDYAPVQSGENALKMLNGAAYKFQSLAADQILVKATSRPGAALRSLYGDFAPNSFQHLFEIETSGLRVTARYGETAIGDLSVARTSNGFRIGWEGRDLDVGQTLARKLSVSAAPDEVLANNRLVESAIKLPGDDGYLVKLNDAEAWTRIMPQTEATAKIPEGWQARIADLQESSKPLDVAWWNQQQVASKLDDANSFIVFRGKAASIKGGPLEFVHGAPSAATEPITVLSGETKITAIVDHSSDSILIKYGELPEYLQKNPGSLQRALTRNELSGRVVNVGDLRPIDGSLSRELAAGRYQELAQNLLDSPANFKSAVESGLKRALEQGDELLAKGDYAVLRSRLDGLIELYGRRPELVIRKGIAELRSGQTQATMVALDRSLVSGTDRVALFDEVNLRLAGGGNGTLIARFATQTLKVGMKVDPATVNLDSAVVYVQDGAGFPKFDWSTATPASMKELISGGELIRLPKGNLTKFRPTEIYVADTEKVFTGVRQTTTPFNVSVSVTMLPNPQCSDDTKDPDDCDDIYLLVPRIK